MIELRNITKRYGKTTVYEDLNMDIFEGEITCFLGESGCGKTTLLNMIAGLCPFEGSIAPQAECSYIFQQPRLVPNLTADGNLRLVCRDRAKRAAMLERVGLADKADAYPVELSGGQAQRVAIARAFLYPAPRILMDEPFSSLDTAMKIRLIDLFCELWRADRRTALFVTHDPDEAHMLAHRAVVLRGGKIALDVRAEGDPPRGYGRPSPFKDRLLGALLQG